MCRYFLESKASVMTFLEDVVKTSDAELKAASRAHKSLTEAQEGLAKELATFSGVRWKP